MKPSIRTRLLVPLIAIFILVWCSVAGITYFNVRGEVEDRFDIQLAQTAEVMWLLFSHERANVAGLPEPYARRIIRRFGLNYAFQIWDGDTLLMRSPNTPDIRMAQGYGASSGRLNGEGWRFYYRVDAFTGRDVIIGNAMSDRNELVRDLVLSTVWPLLIGLPLLIVFIVLGINRALAPLSAVQSHLGRRTAADLSSVTTPDVPREIVPLTRTLDDLLARLDIAFERERRFTESAAHELRTPLASLKAQAQVALRASGREEQRNALVKVVTGVDRASHLVDQLLTLARLEPDTHQKTARPVDLAILAKEGLADLDVFARDKKITLSLDAPPAGNSVIAGCRDSLAILMRNLIDNAIRYTPSGGEVSVSVADDEDYVLFSVRDTGPGVPEADHHRIFERFYRRLGTRATGSGLGLSIVQQICETHGGTIALSPARGADRKPDPETGEGFVVTVRFPRNGKPATRI